MLRLFAALGIVAATTVPVAAQYSTGFETVVASPGGTAMAGQDGFFIPAVAGSVDGAAYTYAGNTLGIPVNGNGGANFWAGVSLGGTSLARSQRTISIPSTCLVQIEFDVCCSYNGTVTPANNLGSFSFQPSTTARYPNLVARWPATVTLPPTTWNADVVVGPTAAGAVIAFPDPNFAGLAVNVWHRWGCVISLVTNEYVQFKITNGSTNVTTIYTPGPGAMPLPNPTGTLPTDFRLFGGGGAGNIFAVDNFTVDYYGGFSVYGGGCPGSLGTPTLAAAAGSRPALGTTFTTDIGNLPLSVAIIAVGFSDTLALGALPLPFSLANFGMPGCDLLADPVSTTFLGGVGNTVSWNLTIPANTAYLGFVLFDQAFSLDPAANPGGITVSNAGRACIGN
jgi:hypothetical protein